MNILKNIATSILSFLLFTSLTFFGLAFTMNQTMLNPGFIEKGLDTFNASAIIEELIAEQPGEDTITEEMTDTLVNTVIKIEPIIKEGITKTAEPIYDYLEGNTDNLDLTETIRENLLSKETIALLIDNMDIASLATEAIKEQLPPGIPAEFTFIIDDIDEITANLEPAIKEEIVNATDPILDYLTGESPQLSIEISTEPIAEKLAESLKESISESLPPELAGLSPTMIEQYIDMPLKMMPPTIELNETIFPSELPVQISEAIATMEDSLEEIKVYVGYFRLGYYILIATIIVLVIGIVLLNFQIKNSTRKIGSIFLTYGAIEYAGIFIAKYFANRQLLMQDIPPAIEDMLPQMVGDFLAPLEFLSLGFLIGGALLVVISFVYRTGEPKEE
ncbi:hypothetical protein ACFLXP_02975 [Chloroflexota bacterium]